MPEEKKEESTENKPEEKTAEPKELKPAGIAEFAQRAVAIYFDFVATYTVYFLAELLLIKPIFGESIFSFCLGLFSSPSQTSKIISALFVVLFMLFVVLILVSAFLEAAIPAAGIGKRLVGIYVVDEHLKKIDFARSLKRNLAKLLSMSVLGLGFFLYFLNTKKQTLHDIIASTVVVRKSEFDANRVTVIFAISFLLTIFSCVAFSFILPSQKAEQVAPKRAVEVIPAAKGFIQNGDNTTELKDSLVIYDPLRETIEVYASKLSLTKEQIQKLASEFSETIPEFVDLKVLMKMQPETIKCSADSLVEVSYFIADSQIDTAENKPEINEIRCELISDSHFFARYYRKKSESINEKSWEVQISSKLVIRREKAKLTFDSESTENSLAIWHHGAEKNIVEIGFFPEKLSSEDITSVRKAKNFTELVKPSVLVTFDLQLTSDSLNVATITKYGVSYNRSKEMSFPGKQDRVDFYYVPSVTENLQLAKLGGRLAEGERVTGYLNHQAKKLIAEVDFDVDWDISFNLPLIDLEKEYSEFAYNSAFESVEASGKEKNCIFKADQSELAGVDSVALYYPEEGDVALGVFNEKLTDVEKEEFRKKKSIWINTNGKAANFVVFFDLKRESRSFSRELLLEYSVFFIRDSLARMYFPGSSDRAQFTFKDIDFSPDEINSLSGVLDDNTEISFNLKKRKESKLTGLQFSWDCHMQTKLLKVSSVKAQ